MNKWYKIKPVDTFFFKGSTPMVMGENHTSEFIFPPHVATISGAVRTAVLRQQGVGFKEYAQKSFDNPTILSAIGKAGDDAPFDILGPFFSMEGKTFIPAPYIWYMEKNDMDKAIKMRRNRQEITCATTMDIDKEITISVYKGNPVDSPYVKTSKNQKLYIAKGREGELSNMGGNWIEVNDFYSTNKTIRVRPLSDFFDSEPRTGIALERNRKIRESHLYSFNHIRMKLDVELVFGVSSKVEFPFNQKGILRLGGEQRIGYYETIDINFHDKNNGAELYMSLSALLCKNFDTSDLVATGKIQYISGWDMKKGFHKPSCAFYPAGSVFTKRINNNQILIKGE
ncbi:MAG: hypothetical protein PF690_01865 [Deltaproteobacteria bacterium]|jgi:CRISPR-associated protein Cmr3|nr:hypothetical protein [Deltaproteobacteria bacterium]